MLHYIYKHLKKSFLLTLHFVAVHRGSYRGAFASVLFMLQRHYTSLSEILGIFPIQFPYHCSPH